MSPLASITFNLHAYFIDTSIHNYIELSYSLCFSAGKPRSLVDSWSQAGQVGWLEMCNVSFKVETAPEVPRASLYKLRDMQIDGLHLATGT